MAGRDIESQDAGVDDPVSTPEQSDYVTLSELISFLFRYRATIAIVVGLCVAAALAWSVLAPHVFRAVVIMAPADDTDGKGQFAQLASRFGALDSVLGGSFDSGVMDKDIGLATLKSQRLIRPFIEQRNLLPLLFAHQWDASQARWKSTDPDRIPTLADGVDLFGRRVLFVNEDRKTRLITLTVEWSDRRLAAEWANALVAEVNQATRQRAIQESQLSIAYLKGELTKTDMVDVQQGIYRLIEAQINKIMLANVRKEFAFKVIDPAVVPEADRYVWPRRGLMLAGGLIAGLVLGLLIALLRNAVSSARIRKSIA